MCKHVEVIGLRVAVDVKEEEVGKEVEHADGKEC